MMDRTASDSRQPAETHGSHAAVTPGTKTLLRFLTCGSVDDGKSTLIGRLLFDAELVHDDHLHALARDSRGRLPDQELDLSLLVDGLQAEREQGITIDVAYRYFATPVRKFIAADTPGHEQYTRNMVTGASTANAAVVLIDARKGVTAQTRRHTYILHLLGIRHIAVAVNKIDLVDYSEEVYRAIVGQYEAFTRDLGFVEKALIPVSALKGDNVLHPSQRMPWYEGPTLMRWLETVDPNRDLSSRPFRFPVQWVNRPNLDMRGFSGMVTSGRIAVGDDIAVCGRSTKSRVARIVTMDGDLDEAVAGQSVTLVLTDEIDIARGDVLHRPDAAPGFVSQFAAHLVWMGAEPMLPGRSYLLKLATQMVPASVTELKHEVDIRTLDRLAAKQLQPNGIAFCNLATDRPIAFDPYAEDPQMGGFILIDRQTNATVGAGMIDFPLRRATNLTWQAFDTDRATRSRLKGHGPAILWFTGLSGAGKSTIANIVERKLIAEGRHTYVLDGDNIRFGLNKDLGFTDADRVENIRRVAEVARLMADAGLIVLVSFISPFRRERQLAREIAGDIDFLEIFVDTPLEICERRDPKGLYAKARAGSLKNFSGIDSAYEPPESPDLRLDAAMRDPEELADMVIAAIRKA